MPREKETEKTREQLVNTVTSLRRQIAELERTVELLQKERDSFFSILERAPYGVVFFNKDGKTLFTNTEFTAITGYTSEDVSTTRDWVHVAYPEKLYGDKAKKKKDKGQRETDSLFHKMLKRVFFRSFSIVCKDGTVKEIEFKPSVLDDGSIIMMLDDITERKRAEEAFQESEKQFRRLVQYIPDILAVHDIDGNIIDVNQHACESLGYTREEFLGLSIRDIEKDFVAGKHSERWKHMVPGVPILVEGVQKRKDGTTFPAEIRLGMFESGGKKIFLALVRDITDRKRSEEAFRELAYRDPLTGLPNRLLFNDRLIMALAQARRHQQKLCVMLLDLDHFKDVNDTLGHSMGDKLLRVVGERLAGLLRTSDTIARMGGDEFLLLLSEIARVNNVTSIAQKILGAFRTPFAVDGQKLKITTSIGIALFPDHGDDADVLLKNADIAMYHAKQKGRNNYQQYTTAMKADFLGHMRVG